MKCGKLSHWPVMPHHRNLRTKELITGKWNVFQ